MRDSIAMFRDFDEKVIEYTGSYDMKNLQHWMVSMSLKTINPFDYKALKVVFPTFSPFVILMLNKEPHNLKKNELYFESFKQAAESMRGQIPFFYLNAK